MKVTFENNASISVESLKYGTVFLMKGIHYYRTLDNCLRLEFNNELKSYVIRDYGFDRINKEYWYNTPFTAVGHLNISI
jgi:hypothetical protein